jgi:hypothetical protein
VTLQDDDAGSRRVNPALPDACRAKGHPSHPTLSAARKTATEPVLLMLGSFSGIASSLRACGLTTEMGVWLVAHLVRDEGVAGSNPATPTST